jgi:hypothetical protein
MNIQQFMQGSHDKINKIAKLELNFNTMFSPLGCMSRDVMDYGQDLKKITHQHATGKLILLDGEWKLVEIMY